MTTSIHHVPAVPGLDPITVYFNDVEPGRGGLIVECYGCAWACFWGNMGGGSSVRDFIVTSHPEYVANCLIRSRRQFISSRRAEDREMQYLQRICAAVIAHVKAAP